MSTADHGRGALGSALGRHVITVAVGVVTIAVVGRRLGTDALGVWALLGTMSFLLGLADLGVPVAAQRALARGDRDAAYRGAGIALTAITVVSPLLAMIAACWLVPIAGAVPAGGTAVVLAAVAGVVTALGSPARALAVVTPGAMRSLAWSRGIAGVAQLVVMLGALAIEWTLVAPAMGLVAAALVETWLVWKIARTNAPSLRICPLLPRDRRELVTIATDASAALTINLAVAAAVRVDVALVASSGALATVAAYGVAGRAVDQLYSIAKQVSAAALPGLRDATTREAVVRAGVQRLGSLAAAGLVGLATCGGPLLVAWAGPAADTELTRVTLGVLAVAAMIAAAAEIPAAALTLAGRTAWTAAVPIALGAAVNLAIGVSLVGTLGPIVVATATVIGNLVNAAWTWRRALRLLRWSLGDLVGALAPMLVTACVSLVAGLALRPAIGGPVSAAVGCAACALAGVVASLLVTRRANARSPRHASVSV